MSLTGEAWSTRRRTSGTCEWPRTRRGAHRGDCVGRAARAAELALPSEAASRPPRPSRGTRGGTPTRTQDGEGGGGPENAHSRIIMNRSALPSVWSSSLKMIVLDASVGPSTCNPTQQRQKSKAKAHAVGGAVARPGGEGCRLQPFALAQNRAPAPLLSPPAHAAGSPPLTRRSSSSQAGSWRCSRTPFAPPLPATSAGLRGRRGGNGANIRPFTNIKAVPTKGGRTAQCGPRPWRAQCHTHSRSLCSRMTPVGSAANCVAREAIAQLLQNCPRDVAVQSATHHPSIITPSACTAHEARRHSRPGVCPPGRGSQHSAPASRPGPSHRCHCPVHGEGH